MNDHTIATASIPDPAPRPVVDRPQPARSPIDDPAELIRVGTMLSHIATELGDVELDEASVTRLQMLHDSAVAVLSDNLNGELMAEFQRLVPQLAGADRSEAEVRLAHVTLTGWLDGLVKSVQLMAMSQQVHHQLRAAEAARSDQLLVGSQPGHPAEAGGGYL